MQATARPFPTTGGDNINGTVVAVPYYWNIAPNRDATFTPVLRSRRGLGMDTEFRYLEPSYFGTTRADIMPNDRERGGEQRWAYNIRPLTMLAKALR